MFKLKALPLVILTTVAATQASAFTWENDNGDSLTINGRFEARQDKGDNHDGEWNSGSSRLGLMGVKQLEDGWKGFGHAEWGYDSGANGNSFYDRLLYAGVEHDTYGKIAAGTKQWSTFYDVSWVTDMGRAYGTRGSGQYNMVDWGISSGTGRAANSLTYRNNFGDLSYGLTYQTTRNNVGLSSNGDTLLTGTLKNGIGASANYKLTDSITVGLAYHQNEFDDLDAGVNNIKDGDKQNIGLLALSYSSTDLFLGFTASQASNWEVNDTGDFFDSRGVEFFAGYFVTDKFRTTFNYNNMNARDDKANGYRRETYTPGLEYHFVRNTYVLWTEYQFDSGNDKWNGKEGHYERRGNQMSAGIRYYF